MRVGFPGGPRLEWYDRNPQRSNVSYALWAVAPHADAEEFSYTVPTGKKAMLSSVDLYIGRVTAATTVDRASSRMSVAGLNILQVIIHDNTVGAKDHACLAGVIFMKAGEAFRLAHYDLSTAGTCNLVQAASLTEFDA